MRLRLVVLAAAFAAPFLMPCASSGDNLGNLNNPATGPNDARMYSDRGWARVVSSDMISAIEDLSFSIALDPTRPDTYKRRATAYFVQGSFLLAAIDFEQAIKLDSQDPSTHIWLYLAKERNSRNGSHMLMQAVGADQTVWPAVVLQFFQGTASITDVREQARLGPPVRTCEVAFYLGELNLINKEIIDASMKLQQARDSCPADSGERIAAEADLKRIHLTSPQ